MLNRRHCLQSLAALAVQPIWAAEGSAPLSPEERAQHALARLSFGARPLDAATLQARGAEAWLADFLQTQLQDPPPVLPESLAARLAAFGTLGESQAQLGQRWRAAQQANKAAKAANAADAQAAANARRELVRPVLTEAASQRLLRAAASPAALYEVLVDFWFNHFNVFAGKGPVSVYVGAFEREVIRPHVFGRFRDMLGACAKHPAMLLYLDNAQSVAEGVHARGGGRATGLNENYARELMELHTLGVDGGYSQQDVRELARILTGWTLAPLQRGKADTLLFHFEARRHDWAEKHWLGLRIAATGQAEGELALDHLAQHPATARHIAFKLAQAFVADQPPPALVQRLAAHFLQTQGDLRALMRQLLEAPEFWSREALGAKFKSPYRYLLSAVRALELPLAEPLALLPWLAQAGMPLYGAQTPDGYKNTAAAWTSPEALTLRVQLASRLSEGRPRPDPQRLLDTLGRSVGMRTRSALQGESAAAQVALLLASPDFMRY
ncbi:DUF1800 domain-containing protein [Paucibacter soli]|uniref:DUF1800 domain-containing protein n=1 Tax=Paucibacter soli TaxID=3133433 RepID=UPI0030A25B32